MEIACYQYLILDQNTFIRREIQHGIVFIDDSTVYIEPLNRQILSFTSRGYKVSATSRANRQIDEYGECHILMAGSRTTICRGLFLNGSFLMEPREMDMPNRGVPLHSVSHYSK